MLVLTAALLGVAPATWAKGKKSSPDFKGAAGLYTGDVVISGSVFGDPISCPGTGEVRIKAAKNGKKATLIISATYQASDGSGPVVVTGVANLQGGNGVAVLQRSRADGGLDFFTGSTSLPIKYSGKDLKAKGQGAVNFFGSVVTVAGDAKRNPAGKLAFTGSLSSDVATFAFSFSGKLKKGSK